MKFIGSGIVWDKDKEQRLCRFVDGEFETKDEYIIDKLLNMNYQNYEEVEITTFSDKEPEHIEGLKEQPDYEHIPIRELKQIAKEKGIKGYSNMNKKTLVNELIGSE